MKDSDAVKGYESTVQKTGAVPAWIFWVLACFVVNFSVPLRAFAQSAPEPYLTAFCYQAGGLIAGKIGPSANGTSDFPATQYIYDSNERLQSIQYGYFSTWPLGSASAGQCDWSGFTVTKTVTYGYDALGEKTQETVTGSNGAVSNVTQFSYDAYRRLNCVAVRMNLGSLPADACSLGAQGTYGPDRITQYSYDDLNRVTKIVKALGTANQETYATYTYTRDGLPNDITDANNNQSELTYDGFDRLQDWYFPSASTGAVNTSDYQAYTYDPNGNRKSFRARDGQVITYDYNALNERSDKLMPVAAQDVYYGYNYLGLRVYANFGSATGQGVTDTYNGFGELTSETVNLGGLSRTMSYQYDPDGDRTEVAYPDSNYVQYEYDGEDRLETILENGSATLASYSYNPDGTLAEIVRGSGSPTTTYGYDYVQRLNSLSLALATAQDDVTLGFSFNPANQITQKTISNSAYYPLLDSSQTYSVNRLNQYASVGGNAFGYDPLGNLTSYVTSAGTTDYAYDVQNRLTQASGSYSATLVYDPLGRLNSVTSGSNTTSFVYDGNRIAVEYNGSGTLTQRYVFPESGDDPMVWYDGATMAASDRRYLLANQQGSIVAVTDDAGTSIAINQYGPYGTGNSLNVGRFQYTGQAYIPEVGLYYYKARMYNPVLGRFMQTDPIGYKDDLDMYAYVHEDPIDGTDPTGMDGGCVYDGTMCKNMALSSGQVKAIGVAATIGAWIEGYGWVSEGLEIIQRAFERAPENQSNVAQRSVDGVPDRLKPVSDAEGAHSTYKRGNNGWIKKSATYEPNAQNPSGFDETQRADYEKGGRPHYNKVTRTPVETPHIQGRSIPGGVRPARPDEMPKPPKCENTGGCE